VREPPRPAPPLYFGGASPAAELVAARHADVYLLWGEPPEMVGERIEEYRTLGCDEFILSGFPHLEEAYWVAEGVVPLVRRST
jgi:alkanesulfonate monooxygenase SsuD/methylene tetrahydromethanopterin reductase-like flavin-dependent oxidoreductase (luciferase family)